MPPALSQTMSATSLPRQPRKLGARRTVAVIASLYNEDLVGALVESTNEELVRIMPNVQVPLFRVPGAFEIPVCTRYVLDKYDPTPDAIIALGVIIRGETAHADLVGGSVTTSLQELAVQHQVPIIHEVLLVNSRKDAEERCMGDKNRGTEAAKAALTMAELFAKLASLSTPTISRKPVAMNSNG